MNVWGEEPFPSITTVPLEGVVIVYHESFEGSVSGSVAFSSLGEKFNNVSSGTDL